MTKFEFVAKYKPYALECQQATGLHYHATLVQAALESGWGASAPGNNFFGIKDTDGVNGNEQLLRTTEVLKHDKGKFPEIISITKSGANFIYKIRDWFRKYDSPAKGFKDHAEFFVKNPRYRFAWAVRHDAELFLKEVAKAGYATDPDYEKKLIETLKWFQANA